MMKETILVVEDDHAILNLIRTTLKLHDYKTILVKNGREALLAATSNNPDVILLDLGLPDMDGIDIIKEIRLWSMVPIIVVSARSEDADKVEALDAGADDYLTKPFSVEELLARIRVAVRRSAAIKKIALPKEEHIYVNGGLKIDYQGNCVYLDGEEIHLTPIEYKLLCMLARNTGKVLTHNYILKEVWGNALTTDMPSLRVFMTTLRKKLEGKSKKTYIQTHVRIGYRMLKHDTEQADEHSGR